MNERPVFFGPNRNLFGIMTLPNDRGAGRPGVLLLNAGLLHRVGPNRMYVDLARRLSEIGITTFRFDMSGIGDSDLQDGRLLYMERSRQDVIDAMSMLQELHGLDRFVLVGLCTGAFNAFRTAQVDNRVVGCVLLDGYAYPTPRSRFHHYRNRVFELDRWVRWAKRKLGWGEPAIDQPSDMVVFENEYVPKDSFREQLAGLVERDLPMLMCYTRYGPLAYHYPDQLQDAFPEIDLDRSVSVRYYPEADHTFTLPGNRRQVMSDIVAWIGDLDTTKARPVETSVGSNNQRDDT